VHLAHFWKIRLFLALFKHFSTGSNQMLPVLEHSTRAKNSLILKPVQFITKFKEILRDMRINMHSIYLWTQIKKEFLLAENVADWHLTPGRKRHPQFAAADRPLTQLK
jgi:hypothetical protein